MKEHTAHGKHFAARAAHAAAALLAALLPTRADLLPSPPPRYALYFRRVEAMSYHASRDADGDSISFQAADEDAAEGLFMLMIVIIIECVEIYIVTRLFFHAVKAPCHARFFTIASFYTQSINIYYFIGHHDMRDYQQTSTRAAIMYGGALMRR